MQIPIIYPLVSNKLKLTVLDKETLLNDQIVGTYEIDLSEMKRYFVWQFLHIYGAPLVRFGGKYKDLMNQNSEIGSLWKGKILMKIECEDSPSSPETKIKPIQPSLLLAGNSFAEKNKTQWNFEVTVYEGFFLPKNNKYYIKVSCDSSYCLSRECVKINLKEGSKE